MFLLPCALCLREEALISSSLFYVKDSQCLEIMYVVDTSDPPSIPFEPVDTFFMKLDVNVLATC